MVAVIAALISALFSGGIVAIYTARAQNRQTNAETRKTDVEAEVSLGGGWAQMFETQRRDNNELRERLAIVEHREVECRDRLAAIEQATEHVSQRHVEKVVADLIDQKITEREGATVAAG